MQTHHLPNALGAETFAAAGAPWVPQEWLFSLLVAASQAHGAFFLLSLAVSALPLGILWTIYLRARGAANPEAIGVALLCTGIAFAESFGVRAQVLGWAGLAAFLYFLERDDRWYYAALPMTVLWANLHASVALAPAIVAARLAATLVDGGVRALRTSRDLPMLAATIVATCCTPLGVRLPLYAIALAHSPIRHFIREWQPASFGDGSFYAGALPLAAAILIGGRATLAERKLQLFPALMLFAGVLFATRNVPLFAIAAAPLAAVGIAVRFRTLPAIRMRLRYFEPIAITNILIVLAIAMRSVTQTQLREPPQLPVAAIASVGAAGREGRLFCEDFSWCSIALSYPNLRVFMDGRCDPYPLSIWRRYIATVNAGPEADKTLDDYAVDTVVAKRDGALAKLLASNSRWHTAFSDRAYTVFRRG